MPIIALINSLTNYYLNGISHTSLYYKSMGQIDDFGKKKLDNIKCKMPLNRRMRVIVNNTCETELYSPWILCKYVLYTTFLYEASWLYMICSTLYDHQSEDIICSMQAWLRFTFVKL
jgi:hypothetical protein